MDVTYVATSQTFCGHVKSLQNRGSGPSRRTTLWGWGGMFPQTKGREIRWGWTLVNIFFLNTNTQYINL